MRLPDVFYTMTECANTTLAAEDTREILLATGGWIMACGYSWDICAKDIGAGVCKVTLKKRCPLSQ
jgi:hypothetical protein